MKTWGDVFDHHKAKGMDPSDAAYRADQWEKRHMVIKHPPANPERDRAIYRLRKTGMSLDLIGKRYSLSSTRVGQIVRREELRAMDRKDE